MLDHFSKVVSFMYSNSINMTKLQTDFDITQIEYTYIDLEIQVLSSAFSTFRTDIPPLEITWGM